MKAVVMHPDSYLATPIAKKYVLEVDVITILSRFHPLGTITSMDWKPEQLAEWLTDLDDSVQKLRQVWAKGE